MAVYTFFVVQWADMPARRRYPVALGQVCGSGARGALQGGVECLLIRWLHPYFLNEYEQQRCKIRWYAVVSFDR